MYYNDMVQVAPDLQQMGPGGENTNQYELVENISLATGLLRWLQMAWGVNNSRSSSHGAFGRTYIFRPVFKF